jgi:predicted lysophospholipase L1 biosynthesis ABC-type transport system permease subunit
VRFAIVGVARNARIGALTGSLDSTVYFPLGATAFGSFGRMNFEVRMIGDPIALSNAVRGIVRDVNPGVPVIRAITQDALIESTINREALMARLCTTFAALSLAIAVVGLYGIVLYDVSRRRAEIGVRMALGARQGQIVSMVLREVLVVVVIGLVVGAPGASAATGISQALLFGVTPGDVPTTAAAMALLLATTLTAALTPAIGAAKVNPTVALRNE